MAGIESEVLDTFLAQLAQVEDVPSAVIKELATLLAQDKLPKVEQLATLFTEASGEALL